MWPASLVSLPWVLTTAMMLAVGGGESLSPTRIGRNLYIRTIALDSVPRTCEIATPAAQDLGGT